jgi:cold shock CspA family protein
VSCLPLSIHPSIHPSTHPSIHPSIHLGGGDDIFAHRTDIITNGERPQLVRGMQCLYEVDTGRDGRPRAKDITNADGTPISDAVGGGGMMGGAGMMGMMGGMGGMMGGPVRS